MESECEMFSSEKFEKSSAEKLIEAKLSKIPKSFSIENLISKKTTDDEMHDNSTNLRNLPPIAFPQNFPFYHPWAANYLMSQASLTPNLLLNNPQQHLYQLQSDKLSNFVDSQQLGIKEMLFNPSLVQEQIGTFLPSSRDHIQKLRDTSFISEFYSNYFMVEHNKQNSSDSNYKSRTVRMSQESVSSENCNNDSNSDFDVVNDDPCDGDDGVKDHPMHKDYGEEDSSYSDVSVTMSPNRLDKSGGSINPAGKGEREAKRVCDDSVI